MSNQQLSIHLGLKHFMKAAGGLKSMRRVCERPHKKRKPNHLGPKIISVTTIPSQTQTGSKKYDMPVIELSPNQLLETHLGTLVVVPPTQSQTNPEG